MALIEPWLTACVPTAVPGGNCALIETWAVVPAASGLNSCEDGRAGAGVVGDRLEVALELGRRSPGGRAAAGMTSMIVAPSQSWLNDEQE